MHIIGTMTSPRLATRLISAWAVFTVAVYLMVAGALATSPASNNLFHRSATLRMVIPEPSSALGAAAGLVALVGLAWARRRS